ncbi:hypothetical protein GUJ93_ZPchr0002g25919 [Zizania palustris]|uniref:Uncharacterized protein n=1 Tax=Zizania palustris TaxID=103762 RepID=A0A8J5S754_ZIZPA|nr:hypothetical protein GUJ93_ZPchr0002g25919 [Zizania palustris]KAG8056861.1 hypothetical protein GUJ93_ZPchr0002g25919 [Zizania palustris]
MAATATATAAHLLSSPLSTSPIQPSPLPPHARFCTYRTRAIGSLSCRATIGPDGSLAALAAPRLEPLRRAYLREHSCLLFPPPIGRRPLAVVKFLGGAFIGAVPEATYRHLLELLAKEGFLVVSVPYNVTFDHESAAREVFERFHGCYDALLTSGLLEAGLSAKDIAELPLYSVGHSNGALLQLLVGSYFSEKIPKANAIVSFNNRPASEAVPYFEQIGPLFSQVMPMVEASPVYSAARNASGDAWKALFDLAGGFIQEYDQEAMISLSKFVDQLPLVMNQVTEGVSEFKPTPPENREFCKNSYSVPNTLLVKFSIDAIDDTDIVEEVLRPRVDSIGGQIKKVILSGTHLTPCIQDVKWQVGSEYTPADALAQGLKSLALNETRILSRTIADWFRSL